MHKIFLDIGAHTGQSVHQFYKEIRDASSWDIFCFEPIQFKALKQNTRKYKNVTCYEGVVGTQNKAVNIFPVPHGGQGATVVFGKLSGDVQYNLPKLVSCFDFVTWFDNSIRDEDFVIVKMNIEGGEYPLMSRLPEILSKIACIHIKLHHTKFEAEKRQGLISTYEDFKSKLGQFKKTFVFCDNTEKPYNFKWLVESANAIQ